MDRATPYCWKRTGVLRKGIGGLGCLRLAQWQPVPAIVDAIRDV
jgi:hypothetical protein